MSRNYTNILLTVACLLVSCSRSSLDPEFGTRTKVFALEQESVTKVVETAGRNFSWTAGDPVKYYKLLDEGTASSAVTQTANVSESGASSSLGVEYVYPEEKKLVTAFLGTAIADRNVRSLKKDSFTVDGGIPAVQDGTMLPYLLCAGTAVIKTSNSLVIRHFQTFISFSLESLGTDSGSFDRIVISDKSETVSVAGNATYTFNENTGKLESCSVVSDGDASGTITINLPSGIEAGKVYYAAINPASFTEGLRVTLYEDDKKLAYATTRAGEVLEKGRINDLGTLDFQNVIPADADPVITPTKSSICNQGGWNMTKKLRATFSPLDCSGITWEIVKAQSGLSEATEDPAVIAGYGTITQTGKETYGGIEQFTAVLTPASTFTDGWFKIKATLDGDEGHCAYAYVAVGDFIDIGASVLWARSNLEGSAPDATLVTDTSDGGDYYMWGWVEPVEPLYVAGYTAAQTMYCTRWRGTWSSPNFGGRYNKTDGLTRLKWGQDDDGWDDDVAHLSNNKWHIPTWAEIQELTPDSRGNESIKIYDEVVYACYQSQYEGFEDVEIRFPIAGCLCSYEGGAYYHCYSDLFITSSTLCTTDNAIPKWISASDSNAKAYANQMVLVHGSAGRPLRRYDGWNIRPVCAKSYPDVIDAANP